MGNGNGLTPGELEAAQAGTVSKNSLLCVKNFVKDSTAIQLSHVLLLYLTFC